MISKNIFIISANDLRNRERFISLPLISSGHSVSIIKTRPFSKLLVKLIYTLFSDKPDLVIFVGVGIKELFAFQIFTLLHIPCVIRLGGDPVRDLKSFANAQKEKGNYREWLAFKLRGLVAAAFLKKARWIITVNSALSSRINSYVKDACRVFVVPQFCEGEGVKRKYAVDDVVEVITITNLVFSAKAEGVVWLIKQLDAFTQKHSKTIRFRVVGGGIHLKDLDEYLTQNPVNMNLIVELTGYINNIDSFYKNADLMLYRSFHDASPNVLLESKRFALPVLANDCVEFRNIIQHEVSGLLYRDSKSFQEHLTELLSNEQLRKRLGSQALHEQRSIYSIDAIQKSLDSAISDVFEKTGKTTRKVS